MIKKISSKSFKKSVAYSDGMNVNSVYITFTDKKIHTALTTLFKDNLTVAEERGAGVLVYSGLTNASKTIFLGYSPNLTSYTLRFADEVGMELFEEFREQFLNSPSHTQDLSDLKISSFTSTYVCLPPSGVASAPEFVGALENIVQSQQSTTPKVSIDKSQLYIGSKVGANFACVSAATSSALAVTNLLITHKCKDATSDKLLGLLIANKQVPLDTCAAYQLLQHLGRVSLTPLLEHIRADLLKKHSIGSILAEQVLKNAAFPSPTSSYLNRSLTGVLNKLQEEGTSIETQAVVKAWVNKLVAGSSQIKGGDKFIKELSAVLAGAPDPSFTASQPERKKRGRPRTVSSQVAPSLGEDRSSLEELPANQAGETDG